MTTYRKAFDFCGHEVLRDSHGWPPPGDPDGDWRKIANQLAAGHRSQEFYGWEYKSTLRNETPDGKGWELNDLAGEKGHAMTPDGRGGVEARTYWRRRKP